jgi:hypothetical protein
MSIVTFAKVKQYPQVVFLINSTVIVQQFIKT